MLDMSIATPEFEQSQRSLAEFLVPLTAVLGRSERRVGAFRYLQGLLLPGTRKSIEPMAQRLGVDSQGLQQFVADSPWDEAMLWAEIRRKVIPTFGWLEGWIVDETGWVKQGNESVGGSHQYCGAVGKKSKPSSPCVGMPTRPVPPFPDRSTATTGASTIRLMRPGRQKKFWPLSAGSGTRFEPSLKTTRPED